MKKVYHLVLMEKNFKFNNEKPKMKIINRSFWFDLNRATDRARSMVHNEYMNDCYANSSHMVKIEEITTDKLKDGFIFMMAREDWDHNDILNTLWTDKFIVLFQEKSLLVNVLANLCEKLHPGFINGRESEGS